MEIRELILKQSSRFSFGIYWVLLKVGHHDQSRKVALNLALELVKFKLTIIKNSLQLLSIFLGPISFLITFKKRGKVWEKIPLFAM